MGVDVQVVAPAPGQPYYSIDAKIAAATHRLANNGVAEYCARKPDRFVDLAWLPCRSRKSPYKSSTM
jgi:aminocarboxymuconate-semialdehyde decarboxylase